MNLSLDLNIIRALVCRTGRFVAIFKPERVCGLIDLQNLGCYLTCGEKQDYLPQNVRILF